MRLKRLFQASFLHLFSEGISGLITLVGLKYIIKSDSTIFSSSTSIGL